MKKGIFVGYERENRGGAKSNTTEQTKMRQLNEKHVW